MLDEPARGVDAGATSDINGLIDRLAAEGGAVLMPLSELDEQMTGADSMVVVSGLDRDALSQERILSLALWKATA